jgi:hypothetical protein
MHSKCIACGPFKQEITPTRHAQIYGLRQSQIRKSFVIPHLVIMVPNIIVYS